MKSKFAVIFVVGVALLFGFQNCAGSDFQAESVQLSENEPPALVPAGEGVVQPPASGASGTVWRNFPYSNSKTCISTDQAEAVGIDYTPVIGAACQPISSNYGGIVHDIRNCQATGCNCTGGNAGKLCCDSLPTYVCN